MCVCLCEPNGASMSRCLMGKMPIKDMGLVRECCCVACVLTHDLEVSACSN